MMEDEFYGTGYCSLYKRFCIGNFCSADNRENKKECENYACPLVYEPTIEDLTCINSWPDETCGFSTEQNLIKEILELCKKYGFGRVPQIAKQIEEIWREPEKIMEFREERKKHLEIFSLKI